MIVFVRIVLHKDDFVVKKGIEILNISIKAFWYTRNILSHFLSHYVMQIISNKTH